MVATKRKENLGIDIIVLHVLPEDALRKMSGVQVGGLLGDNQLFHDVVRSHNPPYP